MGRVACFRAAGPFLLRVLVTWPNFKVLGWYVQCILTQTETYKSLIRIYHRINYTRLETTKQRIQMHFVVNLFNTITMSLMWKYTFITPYIQSSHIHDRALLLIMWGTVCHETYYSSVPNMLSLLQICNPNNSCNSFSPFRINWDWQPLLLLFHQH